MRKSKLNPHASPGGETCGLSTGTSITGHYKTLVILSIFVGLLSTSQQSQPWRASGPQLSGSLCFTLNYTRHKNYHRWPMHSIRRWIHCHLG